MSPAGAGGGSADIRLLWSWDTGWPADTVEFCPLPPYRHLLLCGTYKLLEGQPPDVAPEECRRDGCLLLLDTGRRRLLQRLPSAALLDVKWSPARLSGCLLVAAVDAVGQLLLFRLLEQQQPPQLGAVTSCQVGGTGRLALALDWWTPPDGAGRARLTVSDSSGTVTVLELQGEMLTPLWTATCHGHEAWTCGFNHSDGNLVYTGGDDMLFRCYDVRQEPTVAVFTSRAHEAGVTSVLSDPLQDNTLYTGSYDEHLYTWDPRAVRRPLERRRLDGGVWRIKRHPRLVDRLLTACMYGGGHVTDARGATVASFRHHASIVYGADWCRASGNSELPEDGEAATEEAGRRSGAGTAAGRRAVTAAEAEAAPVDVVSGQRAGESEQDREQEVHCQTTLKRSVSATCSFYDNLLCVCEISEAEL